MVADKKLLLMAICVLSQWTPGEGHMSTYRSHEAQCVGLLAQLDRLGIIKSPACSTATV